MPARVPGTRAHVLRHSDASGNLGSDLDQHPVFAVEDKIVLAELVDADTDEVHLVVSVVLEADHHLVAVLPGGVRQLIVGRIAIGRDVEPVVGGVMLIRPKINWLYCPTWRC